MIFGYKKGSELNKYIDDNTSYIFLLEELNCYLDKNIAHKNG